MGPASSLPFLEWTPEHWNAAASVVLALSAAAAGCWTVYNFRKSRRLEAAKWLKDLFSEFYIKDTFAEVRALFEYGYDDTLGPLIERRITDRHLPVTDEEIRRLRELDTLLNYFEHLVYLEEEGHLSGADRKAIFQYWFELMSAPTCGALRRYAARFGFERLARELRVGPAEHLALYGSLMGSVQGLDQLQLRGALAFVGPCKIRGRLLDLQAYPGLVPGEGIVEGELYVVEDLTVFERLDAFERYDPTDRKGSLYHRTCVRLVEPHLDAWLYVYNGEAAGVPAIESGSWREHTARDDSPQKDAERPEGRSAGLSDAT